MTSPVSPLSPVLKRSREERQRDWESNNANRATLGDSEWEGRVRKVGDRCKFKLSTKFAFRSLSKHRWTRCGGDISPQFEVLWPLLTDMAAPSPNPESPLNLCCHPCYYETVNGGGGGGHGGRGRKEAEARLARWNNSPENASINAFARFEPTNAAADASRTRPRVDVMDCLEF